MAVSIDRSPSGGVLEGADLHGDAQFFTIYTVAAHEAGAYGDTDSAKRNLFRLSQIIEQKINLKQISVSSETVDLSDADNRTFYGLGDDYNQAATDVYTVKFMVEQSGYLSDTTLEELLDGVALPFTTTGVPITGPSTRDISAYETSDADEKNINVILFDEL